MSIEEKMILKMLYSKGPLQYVDIMNTVKLSTRNSHTVAPALRSLLRKSLVRLQKESRTFYISESGKERILEKRDD